MVKLLNALIRPAVALTLLVGAAGAMVAGSVNVAAAQPQMTAIDTTQTMKQTTADRAVDEYVRACLASKDPRSTECARAIEKSGLSVEDFWPMVAMSFARTAPKTTEVSTRDLLSLVSACVASHERGSKYCEKALELSGLTPDEFWAKVGPLFAKTDQVTTDSPARSTEKPTMPREALYGLVTACLSKYEHAKDSPDGAAQASEACRKAIEATGLTSEEFWKRFAPKPQTTTRTEPTKRPESTNKPESTRKPEATTGTQRVTDAELRSLVQDCFAKYLAVRNSGGSSEAGSAAGEACRAAIAASGLTPTAFWQKFGTPGAPTN